MFIVFSYSVVATTDSLCTVMIFLCMPPVYFYIEGDHNSCRNLTIYYMIIPLTSTSHTTKRMKFRQVEYPFL